MQNIKKAVKYNLGVGGGGKGMHLNVMLCNALYKKIKTTAFA
jgi:hypothetical protein